MRKPQSIIIALIGAGVAGGAALNSFNRPPARSYASSSYRPAAARRSYQTDEYVSGLGYFHAPYRAFYPYRFNYYDPNRGYFHGGLWTPQPMQTLISSAMPADEWLQAQQQRSYASSGSSYHGSSFGRSWGSSSSSSGGGSSAGSHSSGSSGSHSSFGGFGSHGSSSS